jgi:predicted TIM-barrel fold metal-dependent hydrolase
MHADTDDASTRAAIRELRERLSHPVIDGDGHLVESVPVWLGYVEKAGGGDAPARLLQALRDATTGLGDARRGLARGPWWGVTNRARDLACVMAPRLLAERMGELGLDFAVLYPTLGLVLPTLAEAELRQLACRALNTMNAELAGPYAERMTVAAAIPMNTPAEAVAELEYAVRSLSLKAASIPPGVARPLPAYPDAFPDVHAVDRFGIDSQHDYDPVWQAFCDLGVAVTSHGAVGLRYLECGRRSPSNYMFNHIGAHAYQQAELAKALVIGGVPRRFPDLTFGFLEGGAGWACDLLHALEEHYEKRSGEGLRHYDPAQLDRDELRSELLRGGLERAVRGGRDPAPGISGAGEARPGWARDEFEESGIGDEHEFGDVFSRQLFFGCEADDRSVHRALDGRGNPFGARLNAIFSSDIGHWDVPDLSRVVLESRRLVDAGLLAEGDYRDFVFANPARMHLAMNPRFFEGTAVEAETRALR